MGDEKGDLKSLVSRRGFLQAGALGAGAAATFAGCGRKEEQLIPLLIPEESFIPGTEQWTPSTCTMCSAGCGILVRTMQGEARVTREGREFHQMIVQAKKIEGLPSHPINRGRLCARGQSIPQELYNPDRIGSPLQRTGARGSGEYRSISWGEAMAVLESKLRPLIGTGSIAAIAGGISRLRLGLLERFLAAAGSDNIRVFEPDGSSTLREANRRIYGWPALEVLDLENTRYLLSFAAGLVETHLSPVLYSLGLAHLRGGGEARRAKFVQAEGRFSLTAAQADEWLPVRPGSEAALALSMAHVLVKEELFDREFVRAHTRGFDDFRACTAAAVSSPWR